MSQYITSGDEWLGQNAPTILPTDSGWEFLGANIGAPDEHLSIGFAPCEKIAARSEIQFNHAVIADKVLWVTTAESGLWRITNKQVWGQSSASAQGTLAASAGEAATLYLARTEAANNRLLVERSKDSGRNFIATTQGLADEAFARVPLLLDPNDESHIWTGGRRLWHSRDGANKWEVASASVPGSELNRVSALAIPSTNSAHVLAGTSEGHILRTLDAWQTNGETAWQHIQPRAGVVSAIAYEPGNANRAYAAYANYGGANIWRTNDGGASWQSIAGYGSTALPDVPIHALAIDPLRPQRIYAGTEVGLFVSPDGGEHWAVEATPFGSTNIASLVVSQQGTQTWLHIFADNEGIWRLSLSPVQQPQQCTYAISPRTQRFDGSGGSGSFQVSTGNGCSWRLQNNYDWVSVREGSTGTGNGSIVFSIFDNPSTEPRTATLYVGQESFTIVQDSGAGECVITPISPFIALNGNLAIGDCMAIGTGAPRIPADFYSFSGRQGDVIAVNYTSNILRGRLRVINPNGQVIASVDSSSQTPPFASRLPSDDSFVPLTIDGTYNIEVSGYGARGSYSVQLIQLSGGCPDATAIPAQQSFNAGGGDSVVQIAVPSGCVWLAESTSSWVTINSQRRQNGSQTISYTVAPNQGSARSTRLILGGAFLTIEQAGENGSCAPTLIANGETVTATYNSHDCRRTRVKNNNVITAPVKRYSFNATAGQRLFLAITNPDPSSFQEPYSFLYGPGNVLLGESDQISPYARNQFTIPADGTYYLDVMGNNPTDTFGFSLTLNLISSGCGTVLSPARSSFEAPGGNGEFNITTFGNCTWKASTAASWITLTNASGTGSTRVSYTVSPNTTTQYRSAFLYVAGQSIFIEQAASNGTCTARALAPNQAVNRTLTGNSCRSRFRSGTSSYFYFAADTYNFNGLAGQNIAFKFNAVNWSAYIYISNSAGMIIQELPVYNLISTNLTLPADGVYQIEITSSQAHSDGVYSLSYAVTGGACTPVIRGPIPSFDAAATTGSLPFSISSGCSWVAQSNASWLTITEGATGSGNGTLKFSLAANNVTTLRRGTVTINGLSLVIEQAGLGGNCVSRPLVSGQSVAGELTNADCPSKVANIFNQVEVADVFTVQLQSGDVVWVTSTGFPALTLLDASNNVIATHDQGGQPRLPVSGFINIQTSGTYTLHVRGRSLTYSVKLSASSAACSVTLAEPNRTFESNGGNGSFNVAASAGCDWTAVSDADWVSLTSASNGRGNGKVDFAVSANSAKSSRTGMVVVNGQTFSLTQAGISGTCAPLELSINATINGRYGPGDCSSLLRTANNASVRRYRFNYIDGQLLAAKLEPPTAQPNLFWNGELLVTDDSGRELVGNRNISQRLPSQENSYFTLPATGVYYLEVVSYYATEGEYRLTLSTPTSCALALSPASAQAETTNTTGSFRILAPSGCAWSVAPVNTQWLSVTSTANGTGPGTVNYLAFANTSAVARRGTLRVSLANNTASADYSLEQAGLGSVCGAMPLTVNQVTQGTLSASDCTARNYEPFNFQGSQADRYSFSGQAGDALALLDVSEQSSNSPIHYSISLAGGPALANFDAFGRAEEPFAKLVLPATGEYWLEVARRSDSGPATQNYAVILTTNKTGCQLNLNQQQKLFESSGGTGSIEVSTNSVCNWRAFSNVSWLTLTSESGTGNGTLRFNVSANTEQQARDAIIYLGQTPVYIFQAGIGGSCTIKELTLGQPVNGTLSNFDCVLSGVTPNQPSRTRQIADRYSFTGKAGERFNAYLSGGGRSLRLFNSNELLLLNVSANATPLLVPGNGQTFSLPADGTYFVDVADPFFGNQSSYQLLVTLSPNNCQTTIMNLTERFEASGGTGSLSLSALNGCPWNVSVLNDWVKPASTTGNGNATVNFTVGPNPTAQRRTATLSLNGEFFTLQQAGTTGTCGAQTLTPNQTVNGELADSDCLSTQRLTASFLSGNPSPFAADRYRFTASANQQVRIQTGEHWQPAITLFDNNGVALAQVQQPERFFATQAISLPDKGFFTLPKAGEYQIEIASQGRFAYQIYVGLTPAACSYALTSTTRQFDANVSGASQAGALRVVTNSACPWTVTSSAPWLTLSNASGTGSSTVTFNLSNNTTDLQRSATLRLADQVIEIFQAGKNGRCSPIPIVPGQPVSDDGQLGSCQTNSLSGIRYSFAARAGDRFNATLSFDRNVFFPQFILTDSAGGIVFRNVFSTANPVTPITQLNVPLSGTMTLPKTGTYFIEVLNERRYTLNVSLQSACSFTANFTPTSTRDFEAIGGTGSVAVTAGTNCDWALNSSVPWITTLASGKGNDTGIFTVQPNNTPARRTGQIIFPGGALTITQQARAAIASAASFRADDLAPGAIGAIFGVGLAKTTAIAVSNPLPTTLGATTVRIRDSAGTIRESPLFVVTPGQINFLVPSQSAVGLATFSIVNADQIVASGAFNIVNLSPGLFAANADGQGPPSGVLLRVRNGLQSYEPLTAFDQMSNRFVNLPIDLGPSGDEVYLILFGTGWRGRSPNGTISVTLGALPAPLLYAGAQGSLIGVDQLNLRIPRELAGRGAVNLIFAVEGKAANQLQVIVR